MGKYPLKKLPNRLPKFLHKYFWEVKVDQINPADSTSYIINRLLDRGSLLAIKWVFDNFPKSLIKETIKNRRDWQKHSIYFWTAYLNLPQREVKCLNKQYLNQRKTYWPY